jgi:hypothetical protein
MTSFSETPAGALADLDTHCPLSQDWSSFLELGPESWRRIGDSMARRQVGLRFMYNIGILDPGAYAVSRESDP